MDKQKQIEEMARIISPCSKLNCDDCVKTKRTCIDYFIAQKLYDAGYRKIQGAVVLTAEQFSDYLTLKDSHKNAVERCETLQADNERLYNNIGKFKDIVRKETAEKFAEMAKERKIEMGTDGHSYCMVFVDDIDEICKKITENKV